MNIQLIYQTWPFAKIIGAKTTFGNTFVSYNFIDRNVLEVAFPILYNGLLLWYKTDHLVSKELSDNESAYY